MADDEAPGQPSAHKIERKPVGSGAASNTTAADSSTSAAPANTAPAAPQPLTDSDAAAATTADSHTDASGYPVDEPPPAYEAGSSRDFAPTTEDRKTAAASNGHDGALLPAASAGQSQTQRPSRLTPPGSILIDRTEPEDFEGELATTNELPSPKQIKKLDDYIVLDKDGKSHTFKTLYSGTNVARRVLIIFVRHFFCGV
jgi:hypothetical protein